MGPYSDMIKSNIWPLELALGSQIFCEMTLQWANMSKYYSPVDMAFIKGVFHEMSIKMGQYTCFLHAAE